MLVDDKKDEENSDTDDENLVINAKDDGRDDMIVLDWIVVFFCCRFCKFKYDQDKWKIYLKMLC